MSRYASLSEQFIWLSSVEVVGNYTVRVGFTDDVSFDRDLRLWFTGLDGRVLGSTTDFADVRLDQASDTLLWANGFHVHGEELYEVHQEAVSSPDATVPSTSLGFPSRGGSRVPSISEFYGIVIYIYYHDHPPEHFHAIYGGVEVPFEIATGRKIEGDFPTRAARLVRRWTSLHREELRDAWARARAGQPLPRIEPLP